MRRTFSNIIYLPVLLLFSFTALQGGASDSVKFVLASDTQAENAGDIVVQVIASAALSVDIAVSGTATQTADYTLSASTLSFPAGMTKSVTVTIIDDALYESSETIQLTLTNVSLGGYGVNRDHVLTVTSADVAPTIQFSLPSSQGSEGSNGSIEISLNVPSGLNATVDYALGVGTATGGGTDYTLADGSKTIYAGNTIANITLPVIDDALDEVDETVIFTISNPVNADAVIPVASHTFTIQDNDDPPDVDFTLTTSQNDESVTAVTVQVSLSALSAKNVSIPYSVGGTATGGGTDYTIAASPLTITAGQLADDINITVVNDGLYEAQETIILTLLTPTNGTLGTTTTHTYSIQNEDNIPEIDFNTATANGAESASPVGVTIDLSAQSGLVASIDYALSVAGSATDAIDFTFSSGTATISYPNTDTTFNFLVTPDNLYEASETIVLTVSNPVNATLGGTSTYTYTITDDDTPPVIQFSATSSTVAEESATTNLEVFLSEVSGLDVTAAYTSANITATGGGADFSVAASPIIISAGDLTADIVVTLVDESLYELAEDFSVTISAGPTNASLGAQNTHTVTISNVDSPPTVEFTLASSNGNESTAAPTYEISLSTVSAVNVTVDYSASGGTAIGSGTDYTLASNTATIIAGLPSTTIAATIVDDILDEDDETFVITLSNEGDATILGNNTHTYTIIDNDATPIIEFTAGTSTGAENATPVTFTIAIPTASGRAVSVAYALTGTATGSGTDYILADGTASITIGNTSTTVNATIVNDAIDENNETMILTLSSPSNATLTGATNPTHTYTISDDDLPPDVAFATAASSGSESTTSVTLQVDLSTLSGLDVIFDYALSGGTATGGGSDYTFTGASDTIFAGSLTTNLPLTVVDDIYDENNETVLVDISNPTNATLGGITTHTYTINDDDLPPIIQFSTLGSSGNESVSPADLLVELSPASQLAVSVDYTVTAGTATGGGVDFTLASGTLNISAGDTTGNISPLIADNNVVELDETIEVTLTAASAVNSSIGANDVHTYTILNDDFPPAAFTVDTLVVTGPVPVAGYWNSYNTGIDVTVPVENNANLTGGAIQLLGIVGSDTSSVGAAYTIVIGDLGTNEVISLTAVQLEAITGFADGMTVSLSATITDAYGNSTTGTPSATTLEVDQIAPAAFTVGQVNTTGGTIVTGYWNGTNTSVDVVVPLATDATLEGGSVQLRAEADGSFEDLGVPDTIQALEITAGLVTISVSATEAAATGLEELAGFSIGDVVTVAAILTDVAGNVTTGTVSDTTLTVDQAVPSAVVSYSDTLAMEAETVTITVTFDEPAAITPQIGLAYQVNTRTPAAMTATADPAIWTYSETVLAGNDGIVTVSVTGTDAAGNALASDSLTNTTALVIDNTAPGYVLSYTDSLVKAADLSTITATYTESVQATPTISVDYLGVGPDISTVAMLMAANDSIWTYQITTPTGNDGVATVTTTALDIAGNPAVVVTGDDALVVDNTAPAITSSAPDSGEFVAHTQVDYTLSETVDSGQVTWTWGAGAADGASPHIQPLTAAELAIGAHSGALVNAPVLVQGATYTLEFLIFDAAGNPDTVVTQSVSYDTLFPAVVLTYSDTLASAGDTVTITATFTEPTFVTPQIALAYQATSISATAMDGTTDSTVYTLDVIIPTVSNNDGVVTITITAADRAGNTLSTDSTAYRATLTIDDTPPGYVLTYSDSLVMQGDPLIITATLTEPALSTPLIYLDYFDTSADIDSLPMNGSDSIWTYTTAAPDSNDGFATVTILGTDFASNVLVPISGSTNTLLVDNTPPTITVNSPDSGGFENTSTVSYILDETVDSGLVIWTWTSGSADVGSPHTEQLVLTEMTIGAHSGLLTNAPTLVQAAVYTLQFEVLDEAGNPDTVLVQSVMYDTLFPAVVLTYSDTLASAGDTVTITATFSEPTFATPEIALAYQATSIAAAAMDTTTDSTVFTLDAIIPTVNSNDGAVTITITAADRAGNTLSTDSTANDSSLIIDDTPPGYVLAYSDSLVMLGNPLIITATFTEPAAPTPRLTINYTGASADVDTTAMTLGVSDSIWTYTTTAPDSNNGFATVTILGTDLALNAMIPVSGSTNTLLVDNTPPNITVTRPDTSGFERTSTVSYTLDETVDSGLVTWTRTSGPADAGSPHAQALDSTERVIGAHSGLLTNAPTLVQAAVYTLQFLVLDEAGNPDTALVQSVMYDTLVPNITGATLLDSLAATDLDSTQSTTSLSGRYLGFVDDASGIALYEYAIGSTSGDTDLVSWTATSTDSIFTATGLTLGYKEWYWMMARATDRAGNLSDTVFSDGIRIIARPTPALAIVQNIAMPAYLQIFIVDTLGMANTFTVTADSVVITDTQIDTFTFLANHKLLASGTLDVAATGHAAAGDSTIVASVAIVLAKKGRSWGTSSLDQRFQVQGSAASVKEDIFLAVVDSTVFLPSRSDQGAYRLGARQFTFDIPVKVLMQPEPGRARLAKGGDALAVYRLRSDGAWEELPTIDENNVLVAWTNRGGNFRLGRRTIFIPHTTSLHQNYPNPFNPTTRIVFDLGFYEGPEQQVSLVIYNLLGQEVHTLFDKVAPAGRYEMIWRGIDRQGASVASGIYFVRLMTSSGRVMTKKMLLVR